jgi:hemerythrin superfamily protein
MAGFDEQETEMATQPQSGAGQDILEIIRADHLKIDTLFGEYAAAETADAKLRIVHQIYRELLPHAQAEEELFYPQLSDRGSDESAVEEAYSEHAAAKKTIESILAASPDDLAYDMKVKMLQKEIQHHVREEETELFQEARDAGLDLEALGERFLQRKAELAPMFEQQLNSAGSDR